MKYMEKYVRTTYFFKLLVSEEFFFWIFIDEL